MGNVEEATGAVECGRYGAGVKLGDEEWLVMGGMGMKRDRLIKTTLRVMCDDTSSHPEVCLSKSTDLPEPRYRPCLALNRPWLCTGGGPALVL